MIEIRTPLRAYNGPEPFVFVSYSTKDTNIVFPIIRQLQEERYRVWYDVGGIETAKEWESEVKKYLQQCSVFLIFVSKNALSSVWIRKEIHGAEYLNKKIVWVYIGMTPKDLSVDFGYLRSLHGIPVKKLYEEFNLLLEGLGENTRSTDYDLDAQLLGLGLLATTGDLAKGSKELDKTTQAKRQANIIKNMVRHKVKEYKIENVFQLTSKGTNASKNLAAVNRAWSKSGPTNLLHRKLTINKSYVAPLRLLTGLFSRFEENWPPIVEAYSRLAGARPDTLDDIHYYIEFCWLSWGPSVETTSLIEDSRTKFMVAQVAMGDEANSLPLITEKETWQRYFIGKQHPNVRTSGIPMQLKGLAIVNPGKDPYFSQLSGHPLFEDLFDGSQIALYLSADAAHKSPPKPVELKKPFYSTAYLWLMLEQIERGDGAQRRSTGGNSQSSRRLEPGKVLPFFEHANLASKGTLHFLQHCLARKAIHHVLDCAKVSASHEGRKKTKKDHHYQHLAPVDIYYRYATALFDDAMVGVLKEEIGKLKDQDRQIVRKRLLIPPKAERRRSEEVCVFVEDLIDRVHKTLRQI